MAQDLQSLSAGEVTDASKFTKPTQHHGRSVPASCKAKCARTIWPSILLIIVPKEMKVMSTKQPLHECSQQYLKIVQNGKQPKCGGDKQTVLWATMEFHIIIQGNKLLIHTTILMELKGILLKQRGYLQKDTDFMIPFLWNSV